MPISSLAIDQAPQDIYDELIPAIDNAYDLYNNGRREASTPHNGGLY